jgi:hypothetical protein
VVRHRAEEHRVGDALQLELQLVLRDGVVRRPEDRRDRELRVRALLAVRQGHREPLLPGDLAHLDVESPVDRLGEIEQDLERFLAGFGEDVGFHDGEPPTAR